MKITIEKTESGYSVTGSDGFTVGGYGLNGLDIYAVLSRFINTPPPPEIPPCLHCGSKHAANFYGTEYARDVFLHCEKKHGGCGSCSGIVATKAEAIALWAGVSRKGE